MVENGAPAAKRQKTAVADANDVITFHFLDAAREPSEISEESTFPPDMCHQFFGDDEEIKGYEDLGVDIWLSQKSFEALVEVRYTSKTQDADDIVKALRDKFQAGLSTTREEYLKKLKDAAPIISDTLGDPILECESKNGTLEVYRVQLSTAEKAVRDLHAHLQPLLMFFVDGASFINAEEAEWELLLAVFTENDIAVIGGFATIYNFWCFPDQTRIRVSQVLVPPPYQGQGIGRSLLEAVYVTADDKNAVDITYEDPTDAIQSMRERIELERVAKLPWFADLAANTARAIAAAPGSRAPLQPNGAEPAVSALLSLQDQARAQAESRISKQQVRKLWEVLLYAQQDWPEAMKQQSVEGLVRARLVGGVTSTKRVAEGKRIFDIPNGFLMTKVANGGGMGVGTRVAMDSEDAAGQSAEEREAALDRAVTKRMDQLRGLAPYTQHLLRSQV